MPFLFVESIPKQRPASGKLQKVIKFFYWVDYFSDTNGNLDVATFKGSLVLPDS